MPGGKRVGASACSAPAGGAPVAWLFRTPEDANRLYVVALARERERGRARLCERLYREIVRIAPGHWQAWNNLGSCAYRREAFDFAKSCWMAALELAPNQAEIVNNLGLALQRAEKFELAAAYFERAVELDPALPSALANLALTVQGLGRVREALRHWRAYLRRFPDGPDADVARRQEGVCADAARQ